MNVDFLCGIAESCGSWPLYPTVEADATIIPACPRERSLILIRSRSGMFEVPINLPPNVAISVRRLEKQHQIDRENYFTAR
jgi:hypothetical protein